MILENLEYPVWYRVIAEVKSLVIVPFRCFSCVATFYPNSDVIVVLGKLISGYRTCINRPSVCPDGIKLHYPIYQIADSGFGTSGIYIFEPFASYRFLLIVKSSGCNVITIIISIKSTPYISG